MRVGIFGGTFAPIHNGHVNAAHNFIKECHLDKLYVIPAGKPPHKTPSDQFTPQQRLEMTKAAFPKDDEANSKIEISDFEINRQEKSYTYYTLKEFSNESDSLFLLCGTDMFMSFDEWYKFEELFKMCTLCLVLRNDSDLKQIQNIYSKKEEFENKYKANILILKSDPYEISSTEIRNMISEGKDISKFVPRGVCEYIKNAYGK